MINLTAEASEEKVLSFIKEIDPALIRDPGVAFKGVYNLPESSLNQISQSARNLQQSDTEIGCTVLFWRFVQGVLKNR